MLVLDHYSFQKANLLIVWLKDVGPGTASANSLYIKNTNGGPVASYDLNLTIDQGLQLTQSGTYDLQINESGVREYTFTVTWTQGRVKPSQASSLKRAGCPEAFRDSA